MLRLSMSAFSGWVRASAPARSLMSVIACVVAFFVAKKWLEQFAEKVSLNPLYFIGGAALVLLIVLGVVVLNSLKIAHANPVESLKNE